MAITSTGIGSGLDVEKIIPQLVELEKKPLVQLQATATSLQTKMSVYGSIKSQISALADAASKLRLDSSWNSMTVNSTDSASVNATVTGFASPTSLSVEVTKLARAQANASTAVAKDASVGGGTLTLQLGSWNSDSSAFTPGAAAAVNITVGASDDMTKIAAKINDANMGVTATVLRDASGERLMLRSKETGQESGFRIQVADDDGDASDGTGLSRLAFDPASGVPGGMTRTQEAGNALAKINGVEVVSAKNSLVDTIAGVTIQLTKETKPGESVELTLSTDTAVIRKNIQDFITAYNALNQTLADATKYDADTKTRGVLQGDSTAVNLRNALRSVISSNTAGVSFQRLADIGMNIRTGGDIVLDGTKFDKAMKDPAGLKELFALNNNDRQTEGFGRKVKNFTDGLLSIGGLMDSKNDSLERQLDSNAKDQDKVNNRATLVEKRLRAQYTALDVKMGGLTALNNYINQQVTLWNNSKN